MLSYIESVLYASVCFFPFMLLAYYPLRYFKRFETKMTVLLEFLASVIEIIFFVLAFQYFASHPVLFVTIIVIFNPLAYMLIYKVQLGRILFNLLTIVNYANFTVVFAKLLETMLFPEMAVQSFRWTFSLCIVIIEVVFVVPIAFFIKHCSDEMIKDNLFDFIWRFAWILPLMLAVLGVLVFYEPQGSFKSGMDFYVKSTASCALIVLCQMMVYYYIARMIRQQQVMRKLEQDIYHQSLQQVQYKKIEEQIKDTRMLRHDLRHHITLMCQYFDSQQYEKLNEYLHQYSKSIDQIAQLHYTDNSVVNALLVYYADLCRTKEILFDVKLLLPNSFPLSDSESATVLGNLLENAYQACLEMEEEEAPAIKIYGSLKAHYYLIVVENTFRNELKKDNAGNYVTTKSHGNGIGILSAKEIVQKNGGSFKINTDNHRFEASLLIPEA